MPQTQTRLCAERSTEREKKMGKKIAIGIHAVVDWECRWDTDIFCKIADSYEIEDSEIASLKNICSERDLVISILDSMKQGRGCELFPETNALVENFAGKFSYRTTIGGTGARAAIAISKLGYSSVLQMSSYNHVLRSLLPASIEAVPADPGAPDHIYPHVSITYPKSAHIKTRSLDFITPRENRILISCDLESFYMPVLEDFADYCDDAKVFLLSCFCEILDFEVLKDRIQKCSRMLKRMNPETLVILEDACYPDQKLRQYVNDQLYPYLNIISMNEDELQDFVGRRFDILNPEHVLAALEETYEKMRVPTLFVHTSAWAAAYGKDHEKYVSTLTSGIAMAATRFQYGDNYGRKEFEETTKIASSEKSLRFAKKLEAASDQVSCVPCKNMEFVTNPTAVGLGDSFAGGLLIDLVER